MGRGLLVRAQPVCEEELRRLACEIRQLNAKRHKFTNEEKRVYGDDIGACIFGVELRAKKDRHGIDGHFESGPLADATVNIRMYATRDGNLDIHPPGEDGPDYHLVLTGPKKHARNPKPLGIEEVFLFKTERLVATLRGKSGVAVSVPIEEWDGARIYRASPPIVPGLTRQQREMLQLFRLTN